MAARTGPALALLEVASVARGMVALDAMVKRAHVSIIDNWTASPGKYLVLFCGEVAEVQEGMDAALAVAGEHLLNATVLPDPHGQLLPALEGRVHQQSQGAVAIVETLDAAAAIVAADRAVKAAEVLLMQLRLATGLGGKAYFLISGALHDIEAALEDAVDTAAEGLFNAETIANPHEDISGRLT